MWVSALRVSAFTSRCKVRQVCVDGWILLRCKTDLIAICQACTPCPPPEAVNIERGRGCMYVVIYLFSWTTPFCQQDLCRRRPVFDACCSCRLPDLAVGIYWTALSFPEVTAWWSIIASRGKRWCCQGQELVLTRWHYCQKFVRCLKATSLNITDYETFSIFFFPCMTEIGTVCNLIKHFKMSCHKVRQHHFYTLWHKHITHESFSPKHPSLKLNVPTDFSPDYIYLPYTAAGSGHFSPSHLIHTLNEALEILSGSDYITLIAANTARASHNIVLWTIMRCTLIRVLITGWDDWRTEIAAIIAMEQTRPCQ